MSSPLITIAMPCFNARLFLRSSVISILNQTYKNWELIVMDDGSTDHSLDTIADITDKRVKVIRNLDNRGLVVCLNECISMAKGSYFARMDSDDIAHPMRLEEQLNYLTQNPVLDLISTKCIAIDKQNQIVGIMPAKLTHEEICSRPWVGFYMPHPTWMGKLDLFKKLKYTYPCPAFCDDQDLILRAYKTSRFGCVDKALLAYRVRDRIDLKKNFRTRLALLKLQLKQFYSISDWTAVFLSILTFYIKIFFDIYRSLLKKGPVNTYAPTDSEFLREWESVLNTALES